MLAALKYAPSYLSVGFIFTPKGEINVRHKADLVNARRRGAVGWCVLRSGTMLVLCSLAWKL
jgi:hypothetical protein